MQQFSDEERAALLGLKGVGQGVVARLESLGIASLQDLARCDPVSICQQAAYDTGSTCWRNNPNARNAIACAVEFALASCRD